MTQFESLFTFSANRIANSHVWKVLNSTSVKWREVKVKKKKEVEEKKKDVYVN